MDCGRVRKILRAANIMQHIDPQHVNAFLAGFKIHNPLVYNGL
jgi:hypothetical protein